MKTKILNVLKLIFVNYAVFVILLFTIEILGQIGFRIVKGKYLFVDESNHLFEEHPYLIGTPKGNFQLISGNKKTTITTEKHGFRITGKNNNISGRINVICLGGSTTFSVGLTDEDTWPYILQQKLGDGYNVYNLGVPGYSTVETIIQLATIVPELKPDIIIIYQGWNDIRSYHVKPKSPDYYWHGMQQKTNLEVARKSVWERFFMTKVAFSIRNFVWDGEGIAQGSEKPDLYIDHLYTRNLKTIKLLCDHLHAKSIFVPQVLNLKAFHESMDLVHPWTPYINNRDMPALITRFNSLAEMAILNDSNTRIIHNILEYKWQAKHFNDYGHFSKQGCTYFVTIVTEVLADLENTNKEISGQFFHK